MTSSNSTTIAIKGRDDTGKAFASVKRGLGTLPPAAKKSSKGIGDAFSKLPPQLQGVGKALRGVGAVLSGPLGITLGAGAAATALGAFARASITAADELGKAATRTGVSVEALSSLEVAARQGGTSFSTLERGLVKLSRNAVDAADGLGEASRGFDRLGISVTDSNGQVKDTDTLYAEVSDELSKMEAGTKKTAIAQEIFGRGGAALIPVLDSGAEAMGNNVTTSEKLARSSEVLNDRMDDIKVIFGKVGNAILTGIVPPLAGLLTGIVNGAKTLSEKFAPALQTAREVIGEVGKVALTLAGHLGSNLLSVIKSVGGVLKTVFGPAIDRLREGFGGLNEDSPQLSGALQGVAVWVVKVSGEVTALTQRVIGGAAASVKFGETLYAITRLDFKGARRAYEGIGEAWEEAAKQADATRERTLKTVASIESGEYATAEWWKELFKVETTTNDISDGIDGGRGSVTGSLKAAKEETKKLYEAAGILEAERFERFLRNAEQTTLIRFTNAQRLEEREQELHIARLGRINLETATRINSDIEVFTRRSNLIAQQEVMQKTAADNYQKKIQEQTAEAEKHRVKWEEVGTALRNSVQTAIQGLISGTQSWGKALSNIANSILNNIISKFAQLATNSIFNLFTKGGGGLGSIFKAGAGAAAGKAVGGIGSAAAGIGKAAGGIGKALGGVTSALAPLALVAAPFAIGSLFKKGESGETKRRREAVTRLDEGAIIAAARQQIDLRIRRPSGGSHPGSRERRERREALNADPDRKIRLALSSSLFRNLDSEGRARATQILKSNLDKFQYGGIIPRTPGGRLVVAGEGNGPEAIVPLRNGAIPVEIQGGQQQGRTVNITVNVEGGGNDSDSGIGQRIEDALLRAIEPGGVLAGVA